MLYPVTIEAAQKMRELHVQLCELEQHYDEHSNDRREFEACSTCDEELPLIQSRYRHHADLWADTFARHTLELAEVSA